MRMSPAELVAHHEPSMAVEGTQVVVTFRDQRPARAFRDGLVAEATEIPRDATRMIRSIDLQEGPEPGRAILELVDGDLRAHRFFVSIEELNALATIRVEARREGGFIAMHAPARQEPAPGDVVHEDGADAKARAERKDDLLELAHIHTRLDRAEDAIRRQQRALNSLTATIVERWSLPNGRFPSYYCQRCGEQIGWIGRALQAIGLRIHACRIEQEGV